MCERCDQLEKELAEGKAAHEALILGFSRLSQNATSEFRAIYEQKDEKVPA